MTQTDLKFIHFVEDSDLASKMDEDFTDIFFCLDLEKRGKAKRRQRKKLLQK